MEEKKPLPVIAIAGPTAVGKTAVSIELAKRVGGEVISVDSRQVYRYLDVGADKISPSIRREVLHHMIDVVDPDQVTRRRISSRGAGTPWGEYGPGGGCRSLREGPPFITMPSSDQGCRKTFPGTVMSEGAWTLPGGRKEALHDLLRGMTPRRPDGST
ncbi:hypothetical protein MASR2M17_01380 [Aminivibrio sp.]